ncbi:hypothetical protein [Paenibacillus sinensis]|uniref:hypothetical protein n=1 Tax=Paenibacillus sinensis TaxID=2834413 RepID=UPI001CA8C6A6|nr:hypothetical protein [Paenibacillus sinensis]
MKFHYAFTPENMGSALPLREQRRINSTGLVLQAYQQLIITHPPWLAYPVFLVLRRILVEFVTFA